MRPIQCIGNTRSKPWLVLLSRLLLQQPGFFAASLGLSNLLPGDKNADQYDNNGDYYANNGDYYDNNDDYYDNNADHMII